MTRRSYFVAEWLKQAAQEGFAAAARKHWNLRMQRERSRGQFRLAFATTAQGAPQHSRDRHAQERRRNVRPIVHILFKRSTLTGRPSSIANQANRINVKQQCRRATFSGCLRIEHVRFAKRKRERV